MTKEIQKSPILLLKQNKWHHWRPQNNKGTFLLSSSFLLAYLIPGYSGGLKGILWGVNERWYFSFIKYFRWPNLYFNGKSRVSLYKWNFIVWTFIKWVLSVYQILLQWEDSENSLQHQLCFNTETHNSRAICKIFLNGLNLCKQKQFWLRKILAVPVVILCSAATADRLSTISFLLDIQKLIKACT